MQQIKNIVFDLGGVIITLNRSESVRRFQEIGLKNAEEILDPYHQKGVFLALEEGRISKEEFYEEICRMAGKHIPCKAIDHAWFGFLQETPEYKLEMLEELSKRHKLYLLSNTSSIIMSWALSPEFSAKGKSLDQYFDKLYLSYEIGYTKPHPKIFEYMIEDSGLIPEETLFIDDGEANVLAGQALGMKIYQPLNGEDFRHIFNT